MFGIASLAQAAESVAAGSTYSPPRRFLKHIQHYDGVNYDRVSLVQCSTSCRNSATLNGLET